MNFKDYFSSQSDLYAKYRPDYPDDLYQFLLGLVPTHQTAWDCGTGNGQVANQLAHYFDSVIATDASQAQISQAQQHPKIQYRVATAENSGLPAQSIDLITVGQALHWFNFEAFYSEVRRVAKPDAILAVWGYELCEIDGAVDSVVMHYYSNILAGYWAKERKYVENRYQTIPFPFRELEAPNLFLYLHCNLADFKGYLSTWSAAQKYLQQVGENPFDLIEQTLCEAWGDPEVVKTLKFPLFLRVAKL